MERWAEHAGTAALAGRDLPPTGALAADQHVSELARALRAAGSAGTMDQLRAQVFMALLSGQPVSTLLPPGAAAGAVPGSPSQLGGSGSPAAVPVQVLPAFHGLPPPARLVHQVQRAWGLAAGVAVAGTVNLTMPLGTWLGLLESPGQGGGVRAAGRRGQPRLGPGHGRTPTHPVVPDAWETARPRMARSPRRGPPRAPGPPPRAGTPGRRRDRRRQPGGRRKAARGARRAWRKQHRARTPASGSGTGGYRRHRPAQGNPPIPAGGAGAAGLRGRRRRCWPGRWRC